MYPRKSQARCKAGTENHESLWVKSHRLKRDSRVALEKEVIRLFCFNRLFMDMDNLRNATIVEKRTKGRFRILDCNVRLESHGILGRFGNRMHCASAINLSPNGIQVISSDMLKTQKISVQRQIIQFGIKVHVVAMMLD